MIGAIESSSGRNFREIAGPEPHDQQLRSALISARTSWAGGCETRLMWNFKVQFAAPHGN